MGVDRVMRAKNGYEERTPLCSGRADMERRSRLREAPENWAEQCWKVGGDLVGVYSS